MHQIYATQKPLFPWVRPVGTKFMIFAEPPPSIAALADLTIASFGIARRGTGARIRPGSDLPVTFNGAPQVKIPAGAFVVSDPIAMSVKPLEDLAVSIHIPGIVPARFGVTGRYDGHRLHPGNIGHDRMGDVIDLSLFDRPGAGFSRICRARSRRLVGPRA